MAKYTPKTRYELKALVNDNNIYLGDIDTQYITDMRSLFYNSKRINFNGIELWDTSNVTTMEYMFAETIYFNENISAWDVSNVENMKSMFWKAKSFNQPLNSWNVSNVTNMNSMFCGAKSFNQALHKWNVGKVQNMAFLFSETEVFNQPIGNWDTSNVTTMQGMFSYAKAFNQDISSWNVSKVINMLGMFAFAKKFNQDISFWKISNITNTKDMFLKDAFLDVEAINTATNTMQNGKIIKITDRVISVELKYKFYGSVECSDFIRKSDGHGYLCLYNFENGQISSIPVQLNKTIEDNIDSDTSVVINIFKNQISDMEIDLLSNPEVFGFCLTKNTESLILSELEKLLTAQFQTDYIKKLEQGSSINFWYIMIPLFLVLVLSLSVTGSLETSLGYFLIGFFTIFMFLVTSYTILYHTDNFNTSITEDIDTIINNWKKYKEVPLLKRRIVDKNMKQILQRISQVSRQQVAAKQNILPDTEKRAPKNNVSANKKVMISLQQLNNLLLISDNDLKIACSNTYKLCQMINSIEELSNKQSLKQYIENKLKKIEQAVNIWKSADKISALNPAEADKIKEKSVDTIKLINNKLKEKIQYETLLININLTSELDALQIAENLH